MAAWPQVALVFVPQGEPSMPHLALPTLKAYLQACHGISADLFDLNLAFYRQLFSRDGVHSLALSLEKRELPVQDLSLKIYVEQLAAEIADAVALLDGRAWIPERYTWALDKIADACALFGLVHNGYDLSLKNLVLSGWDLSSEDLLRWVVHPENPFVPFFEPYIHRLACYDLVGLNVSWTGQLVPLFVLVRLLRQRSSRLRIVLGGSLVPYMMDGLHGAAQLMHGIDLIVPFEGEQPLADIVEVIRDGRNPSTVSGAYSFEFMMKKTWGGYRHSMPLAADTIPTPDFTGLPLDAYLSPQSCLPVVASRGCYYGQCAFCSHFHHVTAHRVRPVSRVVEEMKTLQHRYGVQNFFFVDDSMPVSTLKGLKKELFCDDPEKRIRFMAEMRLEKALTPDVLQQAASGGCHALLFGLESGSQKTLDRMRKGIDLQVAQRVIQETHDAGILTWCFFMVGYPGESLDEMAATFRFLVEHCRYIDVIAGGRFVLPRHAPLATDNFMLGLSVDQPCADLCLNLGWQYPGTPTTQQVNQVFVAAEASLEKVYPRLPFFVETHMFAFQQEDYQKRLVCPGGTIE